MKDNIKEIEDSILNYLYENRTASPQSIAKIKLALNLGNGKGDIRVLKSSLESLMKKRLITKQAVRGNYKIELTGIEFIEENLKKEL
ncbi:hypothetical protein K2F40_10800 [Clostridium sp. CM028]|uniref:hypothetical protein n=1 Tax=unclassified Clostridium TaxID=2614128 RepID=UPI001C0CE5D8|nr:MULTISPECIES: hypothetical protein [unclassified Clostridium]MBU3090692.1 hypothetical protein [Clostridium sp. CF011]MBW9149448.1 hypothetical protein [Clostridium sp. CM028]WAG70043.1 hypothetical protein LL036_00925 [Clostridium sp. CF011]WLC61719.1 hypothetical protein KTC94_16970 [Clostridium sp. CM028]